MNCSIYALSQSSILGFYADYGDGQEEQLEVENNLIDYFGTSISPNHKDYNPVIASGYFLLTNTEIKFDSKIIGFEMFAKQAGTIKISLVKFSTCGVKISCGEHFETVNTATAIDVAHWNFTLTIGLNKILLNNVYSVQKGYLIKIDLSYTARLSYDESGMAPYSDYILSSTTLTRLNQIKNYRFYFKIMTEKKFYVTNYQLIHRYPKIGVYNATLSLLNNRTISTKKVNITSLDFLDTFCSNDNNTIDKEIKCKIIVCTQNLMETISIEYPDNSTKQFRPDNQTIVSYFGPSVPGYIQDPISVLKSGDFILPLSEFKFDALLMGFEFYAVGSGNIQIFVKK